jgi:hypothetical protein
VREPFETLLEPFRGHWWVDEHLQGATPDWERILTNPYWNALSSGEAVLLNVALAIYNGDQTARIADLAILDDDNRRRVIRALAVACDA